MMVSRVSPRAGKASRRPAGPVVRRHLAFEPLEDRRLLTIVWEDGFETGWGSWWADAGVWQIGAPTPPPSPYGGAAVAGTVLNGSYPANTDSRLVTPDLILPSVSGSERLELRFQQWFSYEYNDLGEMQVRVWNGSSWDAWQTLGVRASRGASGAWSRASVDLTAFAAQRVQVAFYHQADTASQSAGWYLDGVQLWQGVPSFASPEGFESGWGDWSADTGVWELGKPTVGPGDAFAGASAIGTVLGGNYADYTDSRLVSPGFTLPTLSSNERLELRFEQWFAYEYNDFGDVQVSLWNGTAWDAWQTLGQRAVRGASNGWSRGSVDLTPVAIASAGATARVAFYHQVDSASQATGWYLDNVGLWQGVPAFAAIEGFEAGWGDWAADTGVWQVGAPTVGLGAYAGTAVAGTVLSGNYADYVDSRLVSPAFALPTLAGDERVELRFQQWFNYEYNDYGDVQVSLWNGTAWDAWQTLGQRAVRGGSNGWSRSSVDLTPLAILSPGAIARVAFYHQVDSASMSLGWYLDEVSLWQGVPAADRPAGFETGWGDWSADGGVWQVGVPTAGPSTAYDGVKVAGTVLGGNYADYTDSRLISPAVNLPPGGEPLMLYFQQWFDYQYNEAGDVQISAWSGTDWGSWQTLTRTASYGSSNGWSRTMVDLSAYANQTVRVAFYHQADSASQSTGWYVDDVDIPGTGTPPDSMEPNDSFGAAWNLAEIQGVATFPNLTVHKNPDGSDNEDYFRFEIAATGTTSDYVEIQFAQADGDLDLWLYGSGQNLLAYSTSVTDDERVSLGALPAGVYYLKVASLAGDCNAYQLVIDAPVVVIPQDAREPNDSFVGAADLGGVLGQQTYSSLTIHENPDGTDNHDYFRFQIPATGGWSDYVEIQFAQADGDLDLWLFDAGYNQLAAATSATDNERISLEGRPPGVYYAQIAGYLDATNAYTLVIDAPELGNPLAMDAFEPNDSFVQATDLGPVQGTETVSDLNIHQNPDGTDNEDYFRFEILAAGSASHYAEIQFIQAAGDLDLSLFDAAWNPVNTSARVTDTERISLAGLPAGVYYIRVLGFNDALNDYTLVICAPTPTIPADCLENNDTFVKATDLHVVQGIETVPDLTIHQNPDGSDNEDYFRFQIGDTGAASHYVEIQFSQADADLDLVLYDATQKLLGSSTSVTDNERISLAGLAPGIYYIHVYGCLDATGAYALVVSAPESAIPPDPWEPNDSLLAATNLREVRGRPQPVLCGFSWSVAPMALGGGAGETLSGVTIHRNPDGTSNDDYFQFDIGGAATASHYVEIQFAHAQGNLDLALFDAAGNPIAESTSLTDQERISLEGLTAGTYCVRVYGVANAAAPYALVVAAPEDDLAADPAESNDTFLAATDLRQVLGQQSVAGLTVHHNPDGTSNDDFFRFEILATGGPSDYVEIQFAQADGDLDMVLYNQGETQVAASTSTTDDERISLGGLPAGVYYLQVYGWGDATARYDLVIVGPEGPAPDAYEDSEPVELTQNQTLGDLTIHDPAGHGGFGTCEDVFEFTTGETAGAAHAIQFSGFTGAAAGLDWTLYNGLGGVAADAPAGGSLRVGLSGLPADTYTLAVDGVAGETCRYALTVNAPFQAGALADWTVLVYMAGDNNLEEAAIADINEMESVLLSDAIQVGVLLDRAAGYDSSNGDWTDTRVGVVRYDAGASAVSTQFTSWGERNTGDPSLLVDFLGWGAVTLPAQHYAVILWDHGGATFGSMSDYGNGHDDLSLAELTSALAASSIPIDVLGFDACLMGTVEVRHAVAGSVDYFVASEETEGFEGWDYADVLRDVMAWSAWQPRELAGAIAESAQDDPAIETLSATDATTTLSAALADFATLTLAVAGPADWALLRQARNVAPAFYLPFFRDLGGFMTGVVQRFTTSHVIGLAADAVLSALADTVVFSYSKPHVGGTGLGIYLPGAGESVYDGYAQLAFAADTGWNDFLEALTGGSVDEDAAGRDWAEPNDFASVAYSLNTLSGHALEYQNLSVHATGDVDWFRFTTIAQGGPTDRVSIQFVNAEGNLDLYLYDSEQNLLGQSVTSSDQETIALGGRPAGQYYVKVLGQANDDYTLAIDAPSQAADWAEGSGGNDLQGKALTLGTDRYYSGLNLDAADVDWYELGPAKLSRADALIVNAYFDAALGTVEMTLFDAEGRTLTHSSPTEYGAFLGYSQKSTTRFFLRVTAIPVGDVLPYSLNIRHFRSHSTTLDVIGLYDPQARFYLKNTLASGVADSAFAYGAGGLGWLPITGDWDGDGVDTPGVYDPAQSVFYLRNSQAPGPADVSFAYGPPALGWLPVAGDWDDDGVDTVGLYNPTSSTFFLRNSHASGFADQTFAYGPPGFGWEPVVGDWNGNDTDTVGLYDPARSIFFLRNSHNAGVADVVFAYGLPGGNWTAVTGDWNNDGIDTIGMYDPGSSTFFIRDSQSAGNADVVFAYGPVGCQWLPVTGDWDGAPEGSSLRAAGGTIADSTGAAVLTAEDLPPIVAQAIVDWQLAGLAADRLQSLLEVRFVVADLSGAELGLTVADTIFLDRSAAGYGWFIDPTPSFDEEFSRRDGALRAVDPAAVDRMDLLTVVSHEMGHLLGLDDLDPSLDALMSGALGTGLRREPGVEEIDAVFRAIEPVALRV